MDKTETCDHKYVIQYVIPITYLQSKRTLKVIRDPGVWLWILLWTLLWLRLSDLAFDEEKHYHRYQRNNDTNTRQHYPQQCQRHLRFRTILHQDTSCEGNRCTCILGGGIGGWLGDIWN